MTDEKDQETTAVDATGTQAPAGMATQNMGATADVVEETTARSIDFVLDLPLRVTVELGRTKMVVNDLLQLAQGSIVELEKPAGEALEILVNEKLIARGEVVSVNEKFGIRVTEIISPTERIEKLG